MEFKGITKQQMTGCWWQVWDINKEVSAYACYDGGWVVDYYPFRNLGLRKISIRDFRDFEPYWWTVGPVGVDTPDAQIEMDAQKEETKFFRAR